MSKESFLKLVGLDVAPNIDARVLTHRLRHDIDIIQFRLTQRGYQSVFCHQPKMNDKLAYILWVNLETGDELFTISRGGDTIIHRLTEIDPNEVIGEP